MLSTAARIRPPCRSLTQGDTIWVTRVSFDNLMARLRDHHREGSVVLLARATLTGTLPLMIGIRDTAGGTIRTTTIGNVRAVRRTTGRRRLGTY
eukprot:9008364-Pyramimonas_sp.AAC.1